MPLPVGSYVQVTFEMEHFEQKIMNTCHWAIETAGTTPSQADATQEIANYFGSTTDPRPLSKYIGALPNTVTVQYVRAQIISPVRYAYYFSAPFAAGTRGASKAANQDAVLTKRTDMTGRREHGNWFVPGIAPDDVESGILTQDYIDTVLAKLMWLKQKQTMPLSGAVLAPVIFHRGNGTASDITSLLVHEEVRVLTRRTVGRGQ